MTNTIALLVGGWSAEREVSLMKGEHVEAALEEAGYTVRTIDVGRDLRALIDALDFRPYCVFNNLHGRGGEDGEIQGVLEVLGLSYTHSGVMASAVAMDKPVAKKLAAAQGVPVADGQVVSYETLAQGHVMPTPYVVKPVAEGSSVGVHIVEDNDTPPLDHQDWGQGEQALIEPFIPGHELTVAVLDGVAQAVTEIVATTRFFDYSAKYADTETRYDLPANIPDRVYKLALDYAERVYNALGCHGIARVDFRWDDSRGENGLYFLEINTQPGLSSTSIGPAQLLHNGFTFPGLCSHLIETAIWRKDTKNHGSSEMKHSSSV